MVRKILMMNVKNKIKVMALSDLKTMRKGMREKATTVNVNAKANANDAKLLQKKSDTIKIVARRILVRPSNLWIIEFEG